MRISIIHNAKVTTSSSKPKGVITLSAICTLQCIVIARFVLLLESLGGVNNWKWLHSYAQLRSDSKREYTLSCNEAALQWSALIMLDCMGARWYGSTGMTWYMEFKVRPSAPLLLLFYSLRLTQLYWWATATQQGWVRMSRNNLIELNTGCAFIVP